MTKFVKKHRSQLGKVSVVMLTIAGLVMISGFAMLFVGTAQGAQVSNRSDTISDSEHSVTDVSHVFVFTTPSAYTHDDTNGTDDMRFRFSFPTGTIDDPYGVNGLAPADVSVTCASCDSIVPIVTAVAEASAGGQAEDDQYLVTIDTDTADADGNLPANAVWTITLGTGATGIDNPDDNPGANDGAAACTDGGDATEADVCSITIEVDEDAGGFAADDNGDVLIAHISDVTVSVTVDENLTFAIDAVTNANCDTSFAVLAGPDSTSNSVDFGNVSTFDTFIHACQDLAVVTNAANGYAVTAVTDTSLQSSGGTEIDSGTCDGACDATTEAVWATNTNNGFAYSCDTLTDDDAGNACNLTTEVTNYKRFACEGAAADCAPTNSESPHSVMDDTSTGDDSVRIQYKLSVDNTQAAAVYSTQVTYVATPIF